MRVRQRRLICAAGHQTRIVRHIHHQQRANFIRDLTEALEVDLPRISARAR
jgi:hypothetical protein